MLHIKNPSNLKDTLTVALEVSCKDQYRELRKFAQSIPYTVEYMQLDVSNEIKGMLKECIRNFKKTRTYFWLREDLKNVISDVEFQTAN
jgi:hypothetical protein